MTRAERTRTPVWVPPGLPAALRGRLIERDRVEWRRSDGGDPVALLERFLTVHGLPVADLGNPGAEIGAVAGAAVLLSGDVVLDPVDPAGPVLPASPCPAVPDLAAVIYGAAPYARRPRPGPATVGEWVSSWDDVDHGAAVAAVRTAVARGDLYQANIVGHRSASFAGDPGAVSAALAAVPGTPFAGSLGGAGWSVHCASPEAFLQVNGGVATTRPIKGSRARGLSVASDRAARSWLRRSPKDRAEHVMIVDLARNDLGRVAVTGGVSVPVLYRVGPLAGLWHAESEVTAELSPGVGLADLLRATFPGGSVTGAPKVAALSLISALEPVGRGPAMGALGWISADGRVELALTIRTLAVAGGEVHLWAGGGVTWGSEPWAEVAEAHDKAAPLLRAVSGLQTRRSGSSLPPR